MYKASVFVLILLSCYRGFAQSTANRVADRIIILTDEDGLPQNKVKNILKDGAGYIWIGTQSGVAKYDGYTFKKYPELNGKEVSKLFIDSRNDLWLGTHTGLYLLDRIRDRFRQVSLGDIRDITEGRGRVFFITPDHLYKVEEKQLITRYDRDFHRQLKKVMVYDDRFYVGLGRKQGLQLLEVSSGSLTRKRSYLKGRVITCLKTIGDRLWIGASDGSVFTLEGTEKIVTVSLPNTYAVMDIERRDSTYWVCTDGNGVFVLSNEMEAVRLYYNHPNQPRVLGSNNVHTLLSMKNGDLWMGTYDAGITYLSSRETLFDRLTDKWKIHTGIDLENNATSCFQDRDQNLWLGTQTGFVKMDIRSNTSRSLGFNECLNLLGGTKVLSFREDPGGRMWVGTYDGGLGRFSGNLVHQKTFFPFTNGHPGEQNINYILPFGKNELLINSMYKGIGIFDIHTEEFTKVLLVQPGADTLTDYQTQVVRRFDGNTYAYVFGRDLCVLDPQSKVLVPLFRPPQNINDFLIDSDGTFWLATRGEGLVHARADGSVIATLNMNDGLPSNFLLKIEKDNHRNLWVSSISGLIKRDTEGRITSYDHRHGLPSKEFTPFVSTKLSNGNLLFGTVKGFVIANPDKKRMTSTPPRVVISDITFQNKSIKSLKDEAYLSAPIEELPPIELPFFRNSFTIHFFNDDYNLPKYNTFQYRMVGLEKDWINLHENTQTTYTNLSPGTYAFEVNSTNKYNIQGEHPTVLRITILPPWYLSRWALLGYIIALSGLLYGVYRFILYKAHVRKELEFSEYKIQAMKELNEKKLRFFTNITHDFKTPLTLISAPLEQLLADPAQPESSRRHLAVIKRNADRLYHLIIDLLDFRKIGNAHPLKLEVTKTDMGRFLQDLYDPFKSACDQQHISLHLTNDCSEPVFFDNEKVKRILWNILSNALKFTPEGGEIRIRCTTDRKANPSLLKISVEDTGQGLTEEEVSHLFERYYQTYTNDRKQAHGSGLGLSIVKGLADAQRGTIEIQSKVSEGSTFTLAIPYRKSDYTREEIISRPSGNYHYLPDDYHSRPAAPSQKESLRYNLPVLLIVEDHFELNAFLCDLFKAEYKILSAANGKEALAMAQAKNPDLIISDVLMPKMDGYELCNRIKSNMSTSHIPVILLTANSAIDQQVKGMNQGADVYITKPFKAEFLQASVRSILENRMKLRTKFQQLEKVSEEENDLSPQDRKFIESLKAFIHENIGQSGLSIETLTEEMNCSKSSLIRKVKALTGLTPNSFLKTYRLNVAYELIVKERLSVSEVSYRTGFSDPNYFTTCFKKQFGKNPSQVVSGGV